MGLTRRQALAASMGAIFLASGCKSQQSTTGYRPGPDWPDGYPARPTPGGRTTLHTPPARPAAQTPAPAARANPTDVQAVARARWSTGNADAGNLNPMNGISKLTIHHEGSGVVNFTSFDATAHHLDKVRTSHVNNNHWADIGYHYIIDRAGRVWEGRDLRYQGAHVRNNNENNIGVMTLGNFDRQSPTQAQLNALFDTVRRLKRQHNIARASVRSHQEINSTACPGRNLQRHMDALRRYVG
ncbi:MAG: peptidoglycan recognition family protein [Phycisphaerales bacterium JB063]